MFEESPVPMAIFEGPDMRFSFINDAGCGLVRLKREDILGRNYLDVLPLARERYKTLRSIFDTGIAISEPGKELVIGLDKAGNPIREFVNFHSQIFKDSNGKVAGVASYGVIVTAEIEAQQRVNEEALRTKRILDNLTTGFFSLDRNWRITYLNPAAESALGGKPDELLGKNVGRFIRSSWERSFTGPIIAR